MNTKLLIVALAIESSIAAPHIALAQNPSQAVNIPTGDLRVQVGDDSSATIQSGRLRLNSTASRRLPSIYRRWNLGDRPPRMACDGKPYHYHNEQTHRTADGRIQTHSSTSTWVCQSPNSSRYP